MSEPQNGTQATQHRSARSFFLPPVSVEERLSRRFAGREPAHFPVMSQISPEKEHLVAPVKIQEIRNKWHEAVSHATAIVVIIGVSYNENDSHIVEPIKKVSVPLFYIGGKPDFEKWHVDDAQFEHIAQDFEEGFEPLLSRLGIQPLAGPAT